MLTSDLGIWSVRTTPEAMSADASNSTRGTLVYFRDVQSTYAILPNQADGQTMLALIQRAISGQKLVDLTLSSSDGRILDVQSVCTGRTS